MDARSKKTCLTREREKTRLTSLKVRAAASSEDRRDSRRASFSLARTKKRQKQTEEGDNRKYHMHAQLVVFFSHLFKNSKKLLLETSRF